MTRYLARLAALSAVVTFLIGTPGDALAAGKEADEQATAYPMYEYVTCAVYFRMIVGSMSGRQRSGLGPLVDVEKEKMNRAMALGRTKARAEYGEEMAAEMFDTEWRAILADMTDQINRNYDNVNRLKYRYDNRCEDLVKDPG